MIAPYHPPALPSTMHAWACQRYGGPDVLALERRPLPVPRSQQILVRMEAASVASADVRLRTMDLPRGFATLGRLAFGWNKPRQPVLGTDVAGVVEAVGPGVLSFQPGDAVLAVAGTALGCHAEYCVLPVTRPIVHKPAALSFAQAASLPFGAMTALHYFRRARLQAGESVLVIGASGAVGSAMVQIARHQGATVTAVTSAANTELARSLGAQAVIDYQQDDFTRGVARYDVIADTVGASSFAACVPVLNPRGRYLSIAGTLADLFARRRGTRVSIGGPAAERLEDLQTIVELVRQQALRPVLDRCFAFHELPQAHAYVETGRKRGSVVLTAQTALSERVPPRANPAPGRCPDRAVASAVPAFHPAATVP